MTQDAKFSASAPLAGYIFQCRLALLRGLQEAEKNPNGRISIEKFDDVAFENDDYSKCLMQAKHHVSPKSLDDKSVDVWKTIRIWLSQLQQGMLSIGSTTFALLTTSEAKVGSAMALLRPGNTQTELETALTKLKDAANNSTNKDTAKARAEFLSVPDEELLAMLNQVEVYDQHADLINVMTEIEGKLVFVAPSHQTQAASYLEGWWLGIVGKRLVENGCADIPVQHIIVKANEIGRHFGPDALPVDDPTDLGAKSYSIDDEEQVFVQQMRAVGLFDSIVKRGAEDYYRAFAQRSKWARENLILDDELTRFDAKLKDRWERKFDAELAELNDKDEEAKMALGRRVCVWTSQQDIPLRNIIESWITSGSFQGLSDRVEIGWHPDFKAKF
ncbi:hypothetical protein O2N63_13110 [Aliiroseovarius sp. KMU-50]|uniref:ABC-three component systems C-terminal domain-containing protein n=1 Tax=Aliiroseovarius salicola TaxID=3009082 RepID=A0ABT4W3C0_9RHOB|nr:ABC-three component system protein [Aliiroseovarius sp. KMU-50]MDA5095023.1 hypothetical protein [Aliiroseovarius sp. KMU-50]